MPDTSYLTQDQVKNRLLQLADEIDPEDSDMRLVVKHLRGFAEMLDFEPPLLHEDSWGETYLG